MTRPSKTRPLYSLSLALPPGTEAAGALALAAAREEVGGVLSSSADREGPDEDARWTVRWLVDFVPDPARERSVLREMAASCGFDSGLSEGLAIEPLPDRDWLAHVHAAHPPFAVGKFFVRGSHEESAPPPGLILLEIDAATAFGSGEHGTTAGCLEALGALVESGFSPCSVLDMGTGSGILGIAAWKLWRRPVLAVDIDRESVRVACRHRARNGVPSGKAGLSCKQGGSFSIDSIRSRAPFDLVLANILAAPLKAMAGDLAAAVAPGGVAILSGMLRGQAAEVAETYERKGLFLRETLERGEWASLVLARKSKK